MLEDCICSMHRYSFSSSARVHVISAGAAVDDYCPTSIEDCPTKQLPDDARRARRRSGDGDRRSSTTTQLFHFNLSFVFRHRGPALCTRLRHRHPPLRRHPPALRQSQRFLQRHAPGVRRLSGAAAAPRHGAPRRGRVRPGPARRPVQPDAGRSVCSQGPGRPGRPASRASVAASALTLS